MEMQCGSGDGNKAINYMSNYLEKNVVVGPFQCNCRILVCKKTASAVLIDPGDDADQILEEIKKIESELKKTISVKALFHTHAHLDHIGATRKIKESFSDQENSPKIFLNEADLELYRNLKKQGSLFGFQYEDPLEVDQFYNHEEKFKVGEMKFTVVHTPGHSPGSVCIRMHEDSSLGNAETLYSGDTLFQGSVGRTDLWGANEEQMFKSIHERILTLDGDTRVCPGHGPESKVGVEKKGNPFLR